MTKRATVLMAALVLMAAAPAMAWGPRTTSALVTTAAHVVSRDGRVPLDKLEEDIVSGANMPSDAIETLYPGFQASLLGTVETDMHLLQAVRGDKIDPYFAYRLGLLGKLVARATAPMADRKPVFRDLYYADVDENIKDVALKPAPRGPVDPKEYFPRILRGVATRDEVYEKDYQEGLGFKGAAQTALSEDASRSVNAISDVWFAVLTGNVVQANLSEGGVRDYIVGALEYYLQPGKEGYIDGTYDRLIALTKPTPELRQRIGDMFYNAQRYDRAMTEYETVLSMAPGNKEVAQKISDYYVGVGDKALEDNLLEDARDAYTHALTANPLHLTAEGKRLKAEKLIVERDARLEMAKQAVTAAQALEKEADGAVLQSRFAEAVARLRDAEKQYQSVTEEFPPVYNVAAKALKDLAFRMQELKGKLVVDAQSLSGAGFSAGLKEQAAEASPELEQQALQQLTKKQLEAEIKRLRTDLEGAMAIQ